MKKVVLKSEKQVKLNCKDKPLFGSGLQAFAKVTPLQLSAYPGFSVFAGAVKKKFEEKATMLLLRRKVILEEVCFSGEQVKWNQQLVKSRGD